MVCPLVVASARERIYQSLEKRSDTVVAVKQIVSTAFTLTDKVSAPLNAIQGKIGDFADAAESILSKITPKGGIFGSLLGDITIGNLAARGIEKAAGLIRQNIGSAISYASDIVEVQNVVDTVFGNASAAINDFAKSATDSFGLTELQAKKFSSTIGAVFGGMGISGGALTEMSTQITGLAGDLASFYNLDIEDAFNKLRSGITGETEPLKQLGVVMTQANLEAFALSKGIKTSWKSMDQAAQTALRYRFIMEKTAVAQGDYAKPIASYAVSSRNLTNAFQEMQGKLATALIPTLIKGADFFTGMFRKIGDWADKNRPKIEEFINGVVKFVRGAVTEARRLFGPLVATIADSVKKIIKNLRPVVERIKEWIDANKDLIRTKIQEFAEKISLAIEKMVPWIVKIVEKVIEFAPLIVGIIASLWGLKTVLGAVGIAMGILNLIMHASPITLIVLAVAALITGFIILASKVGGVKEAFKVVGQTLMKLALGPFNLAITAVDTFIAVFNNVPTLEGKLEIFGKMFLKYILTPINGAVSAVGALLEAIGKIPDAGWARDASGVIKTWQDKANVFLTGSESTVWNSGGKALFEPAQEAVKAGSPSALKAWQDSVNTFLTGSDSTFWDSGFDAFTQPYQDAREAELLRQEAARLAAANDGKAGETNDLLRELLAEERKNTAAVEGLGESSAQGIPGRLNYAQMGQEDFWNLARAGL
jgi:hypothetical protein